MPQFNFGPSVNNGDFLGQNKEKNQILLLKDGPVLKIQIGWHKDCGYLTINSTPNTQTSRLINALIDTGADYCCITDKLAQDVGLPLSRIGTSTNSDGIEKACKYYVGYVSIAELDFFQCVEIMEVGKAGNDAEFLFGRNALARLLLTYDGPNGCCQLAYTPKN